MDKEKNIIDTLQGLLLSSTISLEEIAKGDMNKKIQRINTELGFDITTRIPIIAGKQTRYHVNLGRAIAKEYNCNSQIFAKSYAELIDKVYTVLFSEARLTLAEAYECWHTYRATVLKTDSKTIKEEQCEWNRFFKDDAISQKTLEKITADDIMDLFKRITAQHAIKRKRFVSAKSVLNGVFNHYRKYTHYNPLDDVDISELRGRFKPDGGETTENYFSDSDISAIYEELKPKDDVYSKALCFAMNTILRIGEIRGLKYSDYDPSNGTIQIVRACRSSQKIELVDGKVTLGRKQHITEDRLKGNLGRAQRRIPLTPDAVAIIEAVHASNPDGKYLFEFQGRQISADTINRHLSNACKACGVKYHSIHKIRFYNARRLYSAVGLTKTSYLLGHSNTSQTLHYIKPDILLESDLDAAREVLTPGNAVKARITRIA